jgi:hypothetical protein
VAAFAKDETRYWQDALFSITGSAQKELNMTRNLRVLVFLLVVLAGGYWVRPGQSQVRTKHYQFVRGTVVAVVQGATAGIASVGLREIALPRARVFLVKTSDLNHPLTSVLSDLSGRFALKTMEEGVFTVCVEAEGFQRVCQDKQFRFAGDKPQLLGKVRVFPEKRSGTIPVFGTLSLRDGKLARVFAPHMGINAYPRVSLDAGAQLRRTASG